MEDVPSVASDWLKYRLLAETTQQHCVCVGRHIHVLQTPVAMGTSSVMEGTHSKTIPLKESSSISDHVVNRLVEENKCDSSTSDKDQSDCKKFPIGICDKGSDIDNLHESNSSNDSASTENKSQKHSCAKRLKISNNSQETLCNKFDAESSNAKRAAPDSGDTEENEFCLENVGFNMRQGQNRENLGPCLSLSHFVEGSTDVDYFNAYVLPDNMLQHFIVMDIVNPCSRKSICFTKG